MLSSKIKDHVSEVHIEGDPVDITIEFNELLKAFDKNDDLRTIIVLAILEYLKEGKK